MCHAENSLAFPLETYEQAWLKKRDLRAEVIARHMPPWPAYQGYGSFRNENRLTLRETQLVISWVEGLGPRNAGTVFTNVSDPTAPRPVAIHAHADFTTWRLGQPEATLKLSGTSRVVIDTSFPT